MHGDQFSTPGHWLVTAALLLASATATAGSWMRSEDESYYSAQLTYDTADTVWNSARVQGPMSCTAENWKLSQRYEYGLSYYRTVFGSLELLDRNCDGYDASGIGDLELGLRSRLDIFRNGRTWEVATILPTGYSTSGAARIGNDRYGLRFGAYGRFKGVQGEDGSDGTGLELGSELHVWEGSASEQLSAYGKLTVPVLKRVRIFGALEGDYALNNRDGEILAGSINPPVQYGYDKLTGRLGLSSKIGREWTLLLEGSSVILGRNTSETNSISIGVSRNFLE